MRFERQTHEHLRVYVTDGELRHRGIVFDTIVGEHGQLLWRELLETAEAEYGFSPVGAVNLNVTMFPSNGLMVDVQRIASSQPEPMDIESMGIESTEQHVEIRLTIDVIHHLIYEFVDIEDVIQAAHRLFPHRELTETGGALYYHEGKYYLHFAETLPAEAEETLVAILSEYGVATAKSPYVMMEYGKVIQEEQAVRELYDAFA